MSSRTYNAAELKELLAAKDTDLSNTEQESSAFAATWTSLDPSSETAWWTDWAKLRDRYNAAHDSATSYLASVKKDEDIALGLTDDTQYDATGPYVAVLTALNPDWPASWGPGSFNDLSARLTTAEGAAQFQNPNPPAPIPQPNPENDSGVDPTSWEAYTTGAAWKLGILKNPPPAGTPGGPGPADPPLIPSWLKWGAVGGAALWVAAQVKTLVK